MDRMKKEREEKHFLRQEKREDNLDLLKQFFALLYQIKKRNFKEQDHDYADEKG